MILVLLSLIGVTAGQFCGSTSSCGVRGPAVCGSDGRTYMNPCRLNIAICLAKHQGHYLKLVHSGACRTGTTTHTNAPCDQICNDEDGGQTKSCMSNGITYESKCEALNAICNASHNHERLTLVHSGECLDLHSSCGQVTSQLCSRENKHYMCASNGYTYQNECYLKQAQCRLASTDEPIDILHDGLCHDTSTNGTRNVDCSKYADLSLQGVAIEGTALHMHRCSTPLFGSSFSTPHTPVCADGFTYYSECYFCSKMAAMHRISYQQLNIPISHDGACKRTTVIG